MSAQRKVTIDPFCPIHGHKVRHHYRHVGGKGQKRGGEGPNAAPEVVGPSEMPQNEGLLKSRSVTVTNSSRAVKYCRIYQTQEPLSCVSGCVGAVLQSVSPIVRVEPNPRGAKVETRIFYPLEFNEPGVTIRLYWRESAEQLTDSGPTDFLNYNNARIRIGVQTIEFTDRPVTTGGKQSKHFKTVKVLDIGQTFYATPCMHQKGGVDPATAVNAAYGAYKFYKANEREIKAAYRSVKDAYSRAKKLASSANMSSEDDQSMSTGGRIKKKK